MSLLGGSALQQFRLSLSLQKNSGGGSPKGVGSGG